VIRTFSLLLLLLLLSCTTPLELGERRYREGDRVAALEIWRGVDRDSLYYDAVQERIQEVEDESAQLVALFQNRGSYYERKGRLAESILNYRLALQLRPQDRATLDHVQKRIRTLATRVEESREAYAEAFEAGNLPAARTYLAALRTLDPFDPRLATDERQLEETLGRQLEPLLAEGGEAFKFGDFERAQRAFRRAIQLDPENETARGHLSIIARIRGEETSTARTDRKATDPPQLYATDQEIRAEGFFQNAVRAERDGDLFRAVELDMRALEANPNHPVARSHLSELRRRMPSAEELIREGQHHYQEEDLEAAVDEWQKALLVDPGNAEALEYLARAERLLENLERLRAGPELGTEEN
jgi:tetratricopeptide (TPR) repeat protein